VPEVVWSAEAAADLEAIREYIARSSPRYAALTLARLVDAVDRLRQFPESGRIVPEVDSPAVREVIHGAYRIVYELRTGRVEVLTVVHGARQFPDLRRGE
jgi:toxin ParE1/3/4